MIFKRCTINGVDFGHNSISGKASAGSGLPRAVIPVNAALEERLNFMDIDKLIGRKDDNATSNEEREQVNVLSLQQ